MRWLGLIMAGCGGEVLACAPATPETFDADYDGYYVCLDGALGCGEGGYPLGFGGRYVRAYIEDIRPDMTPEGAAWLGRVGVCLQARLAASLDGDPTCAEVWAAGFATHAPCYLETGWCELTIEDQIAVLGTITASDREIPEVQAAMRAVIDGCG